MLYILCKCLNVRVLMGIDLFKLLIINIMGTYEKETCKFFQKKVQKNLEDKKKSVSLQPV